MRHAELWAPEDGNPSAKRRPGMTNDVVVGVLAFLGAGIGSVLAYLGTRGATRAQSEASRRDEWGRRFTAALEAITSSDGRRRATGRALLVELMHSSLATDDDRKAAAAVLEAAATHHDGDQRQMLSEHRVDDDGPSAEQVESARALLEILGADKVDPVVAQIAGATPPGGHIRPFKSRPVTPE